MKSVRIGSYSGAYFPAFGLNTERYGVIRIRNYSGPNFPAFGLNMERYGVFLRIQSECGKYGPQ